MGLLDRIKSSYVYTNWKIGRYTRRRRSLVPQFDQRGASFYARNYREGEYLHQDTVREQMSREVYLGSAGVFGSTTQSIAEENEDEMRTKSSDQHRESTYTPASEGTVTRWQKGPDPAARQPNDVYGSSSALKDGRRAYFPGEIRCSEVYNTFW